MNETLLKAIDAFRDAVRTRQDAEREREDCKQRLDMLEHEVHAAHERMRAARTHLLETVANGGAAPAPGAAL